MKILLFLSALLCSFQLAHADECPTIKSSSKYTVDQKLFTIGSDFKITVDDVVVGKVEQRLFNWGKTFELLNENGQLVAKAKEQVFSLGTKVDVYDCHEQLIGTLQENILDSFFKVKTVYTLLNGQGQVLGQSKKLDFFGTDIDFYGASGQPAATLTRPYINWMGDKWTLSLIGESSFDSRVLFFTAAYKTSADSDRASQSDSDSSSSSKSK